MGVEIRIDNRITEVLATIHGELKKRMNEATLEVRNEIVDKTLVGNRTGRKYYVPGTKKEYTASAPGEAPASATGMLRKSIATEVSSDGLQGDVGTDKDYGVHLEFGTFKMLPRPWLRPSFEQSEDKIKKIFTTGYTFKPATAKTGTTWRQFTSERMGPYMKQYGGHAGAIRQIAAEWKEYKASQGGS